MKYIFVCVSIVLPWNDSMSTFDHVLNKIVSEKKLMRNSKKKNFICFPVHMDIPNFVFKCHRMEL